LGLFCLLGVSIVILTQVASDMYQQEAVQKLNRDLAHDVIQKFDLSAKEKQLSIKIDLDPGLPFVEADIAMIERVIENLLENAVRHTPPGGSIRLTLSPQNAQQTHPG
jgi:signal transduction histidine kinase